GELFACRRGVYHVAREEARYRDEAGHYMPGDFAEAADGATESADSDPCYLRKCFSTKTRGGYDLAQAERTAIRQVREVHPEWHPQEPRPLVVFSEWQLPHDIFGYSPEYYYQFRFRMTTRDDLFLDAVPMVWGPDKVPPVTCVEAEAGRRSSSSRRLRGVVLVLPTCDTNVSRLHQTDRKTDQGMLVQRSRMTHDFDSSGLSRIQQFDKEQVDSPRGMTVAHLHVVFPGQRCLLPEGGGGREATL
ncbi:hypothetical protein TNCV_319541, partial [Trichonephila clavipes]